MTYVGYFDHPNLVSPPKKKDGSYQTIWKHIMTYQLATEFCENWKYLDHRVEAVDFIPWWFPNRFISPNHMPRVSHLQYVRQKHILFHGSWTSSLILISTTWLCPEDVSDSWRFYLFIRLFTSNFYTSSIIQEIPPVPAFGRHLGSCNRFKKKKRKPWLDSQRWVSSTKKGEQLEEVQVSSSLLIGPKNWEWSPFSTAKCGPSTVLLSMLANVKHQPPKETQNVFQRMQVFLPQIHLRQLNRNPKNG